MIPNVMFCPLTTRFNYTHTGFHSARLQWTLCLIFSFTEKQKLRITSKHIVCYLSFFPLLLKSDQQAIRIYIQTLDESQTYACFDM